MWKMVRFRITSIESTQNICTIGEDCLLGISILNTIVPRDPVRIPIDYFGDGFINDTYPQKPHMVLLTLLC